MAPPLGFTSGESSGIPMLSQNGEHLRRERFVDFDHAHVGDRETGLRQHFAHGGRGADPHDPRGDSRHSRSDDASPRLQTVFASGFFGGHNERARAVVDA